MPGKTLVVGLRQRGTGVLTWLALNISALEAYVCYCYVLIHPGNPNLISVMLSRKHRGQLFSMQGVPAGKLNLPIAQLPAICPSPLRPAPVAY
jgi:hypothetical protein